MTVCAYFYESAKSGAGIKSTIKSGMGRGKRGLDSKHDEVLIYARSLCFPNEQRPVCTLGR